MVALSTRLLWRNWRSGEVRVLAVALLLAVAVVTAISVFTSRVDLAITKESATFLGADRVISSSQPIPAEWINRLGEESTLDQAFTTEFVSMVFSDAGMNLASVKAVSSNYPLLGKVEVSDVPFVVEQKDITVANGIPQPGTVWVDSRLLPLLEAQLGEQVQVGDATFTLSKIIANEPDRGGGFAMVSPRLLLNISDLPATNVIQPGSRVNYRWLLAGDNDDIEDAMQWLEPELSDHQRIIKLENSQEQLARSLDRGTRFLMLSGIVGVLLAGVAIAMASQQFAARHVDQVALMKSLGAKTATVRFLYFSQLLLLGFIASLVGLAVGEIIQRGIASALSSLFPVILGGASLSAYGIGLFTGLVCILFFALPPLWHLPTIPPIKVLRREMTIAPLRASINAGLGAFAVLCLILIYSQSIWLTASVFISMIGIILVVALSAYALLRLCRKIGAQAGSVWRIALSGIQRKVGQSIVQIMVFSTAIMLLLSLIVVRTSMLEEWQLRLPPDTPNHILINVAEYERDGINQLLKDNGLEAQNFSPMLRARIAEINGEKPSEALRKSNGVLRRELNVSWRNTLPSDNEIVSGAWFSDRRVDASTDKAEVGGQDSSDSDAVIGGVSVEADVAKRLGLALGDILTFSIGGLEALVEVQSFRTVDRESFEWYLFLLEPGIFEQFQPTYRADIYLDKTQKHIVNSILLDNPTVVVFEFDKLIEQIRVIVEQVTQGVELVMWLVIAGGFTVLFAAVNASMESRMQEAGLLRALGSSRKLILGSVSIEFMVLGAIAGVVAVVGSEILLFSLRQWVFDITVQPHVFIWVLGIGLGTLTIGGLGIIACRRVVTVPPAVVLREVAS
ncbi:ABC transporter permease [Aurantivibrio plasticivorans]